MAVGFLHERGDFYNFVHKKLGKLTTSKLDLDASLEGHKLGNIVMANIYEIFGNFDKMMALMHDLLKVKASILPVTTQKAIIRAKLDS